MLIKKDYLLSHLSWFKVGGRADFFAHVENLEQLKCVLDEGIRPVQVLGAGSNSLIRDGGVRGLVIKLGRGFRYIRDIGEGVEVGGATPCSVLSRFAAHHSLSGFSFYSGIPGTIGGGIYMNSGCFEQETSGVLLEAKVLDRLGNLNTISARDCGFSYRKSEIGDEQIIVEGLFKKGNACKDKLLEEIKNMSAKRQLTQPVNSRTCGSIFKNPEGYSAWKLIRQAGCGDISYNGCRISDLHSNFLINENSKKASDLEYLCEQIRSKVSSVTGIELEWEIRRIGEC